MNMILHGLNQSSIVDISGVENDIYQDCQEHVNEIISSDYNRHINHNLRGIKTYDLL